MERGRLTATDGVELAWRRWRPLDERRATLLLIHGVGEYIERYARLVESLTAAGIECLGFDHRGHGVSGGPRAHVDRWDRYHADVVEVLAETGNSGPLFAYGHSMGALICLTLALDPDRSLPGLKGRIVSAAGIRPTGLAKPALVAIARALSRLTPRVSLALGIRGADVSHDVDVATEYDEDPMLVRRATVRWGTEALGAIEAVKRDAARIRDPMLILHGGCDPLSEASGSRWLADAVSGDAELIVYESALHEPHNDPDHASVPGDVLRWIHARLDAGATS
ncbi:MAG: lysophospholipase [Gemmatimonadetes bacterium]|nr:lysophospholipase [Gemmatimonadota bacterium]